MNRPIRVLLVDDDPKIHLLMRTYLSRVGRHYVLDAEAEFPAGLSALCSGEYDVCLLDYALGQYSGLDLIHAARARRCRTPIVMLTGRSDLAADREAMAAGADDYLVKGTFQADGLDRTLRYTLERARVREALRRSEARFRQLFDECPLGMAIVVVRFGIARKETGRERGAGSARSLATHHGQMAVHERLTAC